MRGNYDLLPHKSRLLLPVTELAEQFPNSGVKALPALDFPPRFGYTGSGKSACQTLFRFAACAAVYSMGGFLLVKCHLLPTPSAGPLHVRLVHPPSAAHEATPPETGYTARRLAAIGPFSSASAERPP